MAAVATAEGLAILLLAVLVVGLLRSHAEILRRLHQLGVGLDDDDDGAGAGADAGGDVFGRRPQPDGPPGWRRAAVEPPVPVTRDRAAPGYAHPLDALTGVNPAGDAVVLSLHPGHPPTLLAFFSSGCVTCAGLWRQLAAAGPAGVGLPVGVRIVVVTRSPGEESESEVARLAPGTVVVMSNEAWEAFAVPASPYFVLVRDGAIVGEGAVRDWRELAVLVAQASADLGVEAAARPAGQRKEREDGSTREAHADEALRAAGIHPGDPSLYPPVANR